MQNQPKRLNNGPVVWLLEPDNPSVRYFALRTLLDRSKDDAKVHVAQSGKRQGE